MIKVPFQYEIPGSKQTGFSAKRKTVSSSYSLHWHRCCEIEFILGGRGSQVLNGTRYDLLPGTIYMLTPADCHSVEACEPLDIGGIMFEEKLVSKSLYERILTFETLGYNLCARLSGQSFSSVSGFVNSLLAEDRAENFDEFGDMYVSNLIDCLLVELLRNCQSAPVGIGKSQVSAAILYLHSHYTEEVTLDTLASVCHLSKNYFSEIFRASTGSTFKSYLIELRLRQACRLLASTDMTVTDICYASGFDTFSNFMRRFRKRFGQTPLDFRVGNQNKFSE